MNIRNWLMGALLTGLLAAAPAYAGPFIDWDPMYVYGPGASISIEASMLRRPATRVLLTAMPILLDAQHQQPQASSMLGCCVN